MKSFLNFCMAIAILFVVAVGGGAAYLVYKGVGLAGDGADVIQKDGIKGLATRLWCGERGCR